MKYHPAAAIIVLFSLAGCTSETVGPLQESDAGTSTTFDSPEATFEAARTALV